MSKILIGASIALLTLAVAFGLLNANRARSLKAAAARSDTARMEAERVRASKEKELKAREAALADASAKAGADPGKVAEAEAELVKSQAEKQELQAKLQANEAEIADLKKRVQEAGTAASPGAPPAENVAELQTQLNEARKQLDAAEREKALLSDKMNAVEERSTQLKTEKKRRVAATGASGIRGTVLAVNQAYNFVVLNLGARQGLEANGEMLVIRGGSAVGKIRISSVEPATAIGDIISSSLARGVQVQPGDNVIYAGSN